MKLVIDHQIFSTQAYGGISRYFVELANHLSAIKNAEPIVLAPLNFNMYFSDLKPAVAMGKHISGLPQKGRVVRMLNRFMTRLWLSKTRPEIVHSTYFYDTRCTYNKEAKIIITVHDMIHELFPEDFPSSDNTAELKRKAVEMADHVICVSENTRNDLVRLSGVDPKKTSVVHHGVNNIDQNFAPKSKLPNSPYLLYVGNRKGYKNYSGLVGAYAKSTELHNRFKLVCFGGEPFSQREQKHQESLGLNSGQVLWLEGGDSLLASLYKNASVFVYPSLYEGFGMPPLEAMSFGCPVVCSNQGSIPEVVDDAGEYFNPNNIEDIITAITRVTNNPSHADELRRKGTLQLKKFSWQRCAEKTYRIYESILQDN